jgi:NAD(P)H-dependent flavin oxidoreductase YrpB (nitropropane dioxygenase family)
MHTPLCDELGIEFPIFAFTHCRDVVVAVSKAGGFGVLGAVGFTPEQLEIELNWIDERIGDHPYGVDIVIPNKYEGMDTDMSGEELAEALRKLVPQQHLDFAKKVLADHGVPTADADSNALQLLGWTEATATPQVEVALRHPKVTLIANALGTPPADMIAHIHAAGRKVAALCGSPAQARKHADADVDIIIAQGGEGGGHCGGRWHRKRRPDRRRAGHGVPGDVVRLAVADGRGGREHPGPAGRLRPGQQPRHRPEPVVHRQALSHASQRVDAGLGNRGESATVGNAVAVHGFWDGGGRHKQVPRRDY